VPLAKKHREVLAKLDPVAITRYQISEKDIRTIERYLKIIQADLYGVFTWQDILDFDGPYSTSIVIHEFVEIRLLLEAGVQPLKLKPKALRAALAANKTAHVVALYEEHIFLQEYIQRQFQQQFQIATLIMANRDEDDLELFLESDLGVYFLEEERVEEAQVILDQMKGEAA
jgi:hypothetical protein